MKINNKNCPFISIVIPFREAQGNIEECVKSLLEQDFPRDAYEIILVDNGSRDGAGGRLKKHKELILLKEKKIGHGAARNKGAFFARGEIIAFTDSDCIADKGWLKYLAESFREGSAAAFAGEIKAYDPHTDIEVFYEGHMSQKRSLSFNDPYAVMANFAVRSSVFKKIGGFDGNFSQGEDVDFSWRLQHEGGKIAYCPQALVYHKNVKTKLRLFIKFFWQSFYAPKVRKKNIKFLERKNKSERIGVNHYKELIKNIHRFFLAKQKNFNKKDIELQIIFLLARKIGLLCGSVRFWFLYI